MKRPCIQLETAFIHDAPFIGMSIAEIGLWVWGMSHANNQVSDGFVPAAALQRLDTTLEVAHQLCRIGLWREVDAGFRIINFEKYGTLRQDYADQENTVRQDDVLDSQYELSGAYVEQRSDLGSQRSTSLDSSLDTLISESAPKVHAQPSAAQSGRSTKKQRRSAGASCNTQPIIGAFIKQYEAARRVQPVITPRDGKSAKELLKLLGVERAIEAIENAFEDAWFASKVASLHVIAADPNRYLGKPSQFRTTGPDPRHPWSKLL